MKVGTWNLYFANGNSDIRSGLKAFALKEVDVLCVQELSNNAKEIYAKSVMKEFGYTATSRSSAVTIFVRDATFEILSQQFKLVTEGGQSWEPGTGGSRVIYKGIMGVQLKNKLTGEVSWHLNNHIVPGIEKSGKLRTDVPIRKGVYISQVQKLTDWVKELKVGGIMVTTSGDMNLAWGTEAGADLGRRMATAGLLANWATMPDADTHTSDRGIDYTHITNGYVESQTLMGYYGSDHRGFYVHVKHGSKPVVKPPTTTTIDKSAQGTWEVTVDKGSFLYGIPYDVTRKIPKKDWKRRKDGYKVNTGIGWVKRKDSTGKMRTYLRTRAGWLYAKDYLRKR